MNKVYKVYIANQDVLHIAQWLKSSAIKGATIAPGWGYWEGELEPQHTVEVIGSVYDWHYVDDFIRYALYETGEKCVHLTIGEVEISKEVWRD